MDNCAFMIPSDSTKEVIWQLYQSTVFSLGAHTALVAGILILLAMAMVRLQHHCWMGDQFQALPHMSTYATRPITFITFRVNQMLILHHSVEFVVYNQHLLHFSACFLYSYVHSNKSKNCLEKCKLSSKVSITEITDIKITVPCSYNVCRMIL
jgi:hypothetical protein